MSVTAHVRELWHRFNSGRPGHRFQDHYDKVARRPNRPWWQRALKIVAAVAALAIGLVEIVFPGPAVFFLAVGGALLATESRTAARVMDWADVRVRKVYRFLRDRWRRASRGRRTAVVGLLVCGGVAGAALVYQVIRD